MFNANEHLTALSGKAYLEVKWRLVWFREDHPLWNIETTMVHYDTEKQLAVFAAKITDENGNQRSSGYGSETQKDFRDYLEKAETKAVGRALAMLGYGTQFAPELEEGERIVDSPVERPQAVETLEQAAAYTITFGKNRGKTLGELYRTDHGYIDWLAGNDRTDPVIKKAIAMMEQAVAAKKTTRRNRRAEIDAEAYAENYMHEDAGDRV